MTDPADRFLEDSCTRWPAGSASRSCRPRTTYAAAAAGCSGCGWRWPARPPRRWPSCSVSPASPPATRRRPSRPSSTRRATCPRRRAARRHRDSATPRLESPRTARATRRHRSGAAGPGSQHTEGGPRPRTPPTARPPAAPRRDDETSDRDARRPRLLAGLRPDRGAQLDGRPRPRRRPGHPPRRRPRPRPRRRRRPDHDAHGAADRRRRRSGSIRCCATTTTCSPSGSTPSGSTSSPTTARSTPSRRRPHAAGSTPSARPTAGRTALDVRPPDHGRQRVGPGQLAVRRVLRRLGLPFRDHKTPTRPARRRRRSRPTTGCARSRSSTRRPGRGGHRRRDVRRCGARRRHREHRGRPGRGGGRRAADPARASRRSRRPGSTSTRSPTAGVAALVKPGETFEQTGISRSPWVRGARSVGGVASGTVAWTVRPVYSQGPFTC